VGAINTIVDLAVLNLLIAATHTGKTGASFALFKSIAFVCALLNSYLMNRSWTFESDGRKTRVVEGSQFLVVSLLGALVNVGGSWYVATFVSHSPELDRYWPSIAALVGTAFSLGFNFVGYKYFVFTRSRRSNIKEPVRNPPRFSRQRSATD
jgi:putative flippase GtrA